MKYDRQGQKPVRCPVCARGRVIDVAAGMDISRLALFGPHQSQNAQFFSKCPKCGLQIGIAVC